MLYYAIILEKPRFRIKDITDALSIMLRLLGEELEAASWLIKA